MYTDKFIKFVIAIESITGKIVKNDQLPTVQKCLELGYSAQTAAHLI